MSKPTLNIGVEATKVGFIFKDNTGKYSSSNPKGWRTGTNDWSISNATGATLRITDPNGVTTSISIYPDFPSIDNACKEILAGDIGMSEIKSGKYVFDYRVNISNSTGSHTVKTTLTMYHIKSIECCIESKKLALSDYASEQACKVFVMDMLLNSAKNAICKGDTSSAEEIISYLDNKCNCKCC